MKKYVWLLIAAAFAVAVLAMVGCRPAETPAASPSPSPTVAPTPDTRCPQPVSTVVRNLYNPYTGDGEDKIEIVITFDEPIAGDEDCITNPDYWEFTVVNATRYDGDTTDDEAPADDVEITPDEISLSSDGKKITIKATVAEGDVGSFGYGLICDEDSADAYREALEAQGVSNVKKYATTADLVKWKLSRWCAVYDELGNRCCEDLEGEACCTTVCEPGPTPPSGCPL